MSTNIYWITNTAGWIYATNHYITNLYFGELSPQVRSNLLEYLRAQNQHWWQYQVDVWWIFVAIFAAAAVTYLALATIRNKW